MARSATYPAVLESKTVRLVPLGEEHVEPLLAIGKAFPAEYRLTSAPVDDEQGRDYFATAFADQEAGKAYPFTVVHRHDSAVIGATRLTDIHWRHRHCELGYTWFHPRFHGSSVNVESKLLILSFAFEVLELHRVQIHTDTRNERSQRAIRALGATQEGILRRHMVAKDGYVRDTMVFSVVDTEWPQVKERIEARIRSKGSDPTMRMELPAAS